MAAVIAAAAVAWRTNIDRGDFRQAGTAPQEETAPAPATTAQSPPEDAAPTPTPPEPPPPPPPERVKALFDAAGVAYPPTRVLFAAFKEERLLDLYARSRKGKWRFVHRYPILGASGSSGPKLMEGDRQVPEGVYAVESLHPNSKFHLALRLDYPNAFDREMGAADKRPKLGGDIMIHGGSASSGCLAMGDPAIEELYELAEKTRLRNIKVIIAPFDMRAKPRQNLPRQPNWVAELYGRIASELTKLPLTPAS